MPNWCQKSANHYYFQLYCSTIDSEVALSPPPTFADPCILFTEVGGGDREQEGRNTGKDIKTMHGEKLESGANGSKNDFRGESSKVF